MSKPIKRIGILTGGGDCPGINAVIRAVVKTAIRDHKWECVGILDGFQGLIENRMRPLEWTSASNILTRGGTILGTSNKANPAKYAVGMDAEGKPIFKDVREQAYANYEDNGLDALVVIGGDGTMSCAAGMIELGARCVGVPKTIDNDLMHTHVTFGFQTAVEIATEALDRVHTTAASHHRILLVELMGRNAGWLTLHAGLASGSDVILIPEIPYTLDRICAACEDRKKHGKYFTIIAISEGAHPIDGKQTISRVVTDSHEAIRLGGVATLLSVELEEATGIESRAVVLGHVQRGGTPCAADRVLATRFGHEATELLAKGKYNELVVIQEGQLRSVPISSVANQQRLVDPKGDLVNIARSVGTSMGD
ncbi:MAG: 6-phosphofructokinase [Phycisphaerales bacterium]|nr:6-phosphofructokinase [Phycisphaerales bacterium]MCB9863437.1 6-phosphofructokinase [Phycisphaerales bacterium]